jgi:accessory colonization factor AcfC
MMTRIALGLALSLSTLTAARAAEPLHVYGPGGPFPAMQEIAAGYGKAHGIDVLVTAGPTPKWLPQAKLDADVVFSGAETMMTDFETAFDGQIDPASITPLYLRPSTILVRPGNPHHIKGLADLLKPGHKVLVVNGAGQGGLWEDVAGRLGDIRTVRALRANIGAFAKNSAEARALWTNDSSYDSWLIWNIWQVANPTITQSVPVEAKYRIYRDTGVALTQRGEQRPEAKAFVAYLSSPEAAAIFAKWGWMTQAHK